MEDVYKGWTFLHSSQIFVYFSRLGNWEWTQNFHHITMYSDGIDTLPPVFYGLQYCIHTAYMALKIACLCALRICVIGLSNSKQQKTCLVSWSHYTAIQGNGRLSLVYCGLISINVGIHRSWIFHDESVISHCWWGMKAKITHMVVQVNIPITYHWLDTGNMIEQAVCVLWWPVGISHIMGRMNHSYC